MTVIELLLAILLFCLALAVSLLQDDIKELKMHDQAQWESLSNLCEANSNLCEAIRSLKEDQND